MIQEACNLQVQLHLFPFRNQQWIGFSGWYFWFSMGFKSHSAPCWWWMVWVKYVPLKCSLTKVAIATALQHTYLLAICISQLLSCISSIIEFVFTYLYLSGGLTLCLFFPLLILSLANWRIYLLFPASLDKGHSRVSRVMLVLREYLLLKPHPWGKCCGACFLNCLVIDIFIQ